MCSLPPLTQTSRWRVEGGGGHKYNNTYDDAVDDASPLTAAVRASRRAHAATSTSSTSSSRRTSTSSSHSSNASIERYVQHIARRVWAGTQDEGGYMTMLRGVRMQFLHSSASGGVCSSVVTTPPQQQQQQQQQHSVSTAKSTHDCGAFSSSSPSTTTTTATAAMAAAMTMTPQLPIVLPPFVPSVLRARVPTVTHFVDGMQLLRSHDTNNSNTSTTTTTTAPLSLPQLCNVEHAARVHLTAMEQWERRVVGELMLVAYVTSILRPQMEELQSRERAARCVVQAEEERTRYTLTHESPMACTIAAGVRALYATQLKRARLAQLDGDAAATTTTAATRRGGATTAADGGMSDVRAIVQRYIRDKHNLYSSSSSKASDKTTTATATTAAAAAAAITTPTTAAAAAAATTRWLPPLFAGSSTSAAAVRVSHNNTIGVADCVALLAADAQQRELIAHGEADERAAVARAEREERVSARAWQRKRMHLERLLEWRAQREVQLQAEVEALTRIGGDNDKNDCNNNTEGDNEASDAAHGLRQQQLRQQRRQLLSSSACAHLVAAEARARDAIVTDATSLHATMTRKHDDANATAFARLCAAHAAVQRAEPRAQLCVTWQHARQALCVAAWGGYVDLLVMHEQRVRRATVTAAWERWCVDVVQPRQRALALLVRVAHDAAAMTALRTLQRAVRAWASWQDDEDGGTGNNSGAADGDHTTTTATRRYRRFGWHYTHVQLGRALRAQRAAAAVTRGRRALAEARDALARETAALYAEQCAADAAARAALAQREAAARIAVREHEAAVYASYSIEWADALQRDVTAPRVRQLCAREQRTRTHDLVDAEAAAWAALQAAARDAHAAAAAQCALREAEGAARDGLVADGVAACASLVLRSTTALRLLQQHEAQALRLCAAHTSLVTLLCGQARVCVSLLRATHAESQRLLCVAREEAVTLWAQHAVHSAAMWSAAWLRSCEEDVARLHTAHVDAVTRLHDREERQAAAAAAAAETATAQAHGDADVAAHDDEGDDDKHNKDEAAAAARIACAYRRFRRGSLGRRARQRRLHEALQPLRDAVAAAMAATPQQAQRQAQQTDAVHATATTRRLSPASAAAALHTLVTDDEPSARAVLLSQCALAWSMLTREAAATTDTTTSAVTRHDDSSHDEAAAACRATRKAVLRLCEWEAYERVCVLRQWRNEVAQVLLPQRARIVYDAHACRLQRWWRVRCARVRAAAARQQLLRDEAVARAQLAAAAYAEVVGDVVAPTQHALAQAHYVHDVLAPALQTRQCALHRAAVAEGEWVARVRLLWCARRDVYTRCLCVEEAQLRRDALARTHAEALVQHAVRAEEALRRQLLQRERTLWLLRLLGKVEVLMRWYSVEHAQHVAFAALLRAHHDIVNPDVTP